MPLSAAAEYNHSSQSLGRLRRLVAPLLFRAVSLIRLRAARPLAVTGFPASACGHRSPGNHSTRIPKDTHRRRRTPTTSPSLHEPKLANRRRRAPCITPSRPKPARPSQSVARRAPPGPKPTRYPRSRPSSHRATEAAFHAQRLLRHPTWPKPHGACRADPIYPRGRNQHVVDRARSGLAPRTEARVALIRPVSKKPSAQVSLNRAQPARPACATEVAPARRCRAASRSTARTVNPMKRPAESFSIHAPTREIRRADPSSDKSLEPAVRRHRPRP